MARENINDIVIFIAVARERSFTGAAAKLGLTQSALSHIVRSLEARLGVRLLTRTTRSVSPTEAGERLLQNVAPRLEEIEAELAAITDLIKTPAGNIRITAIDSVIDTILWPRLAPILPKYPDLRVEFNADYRMLDIAADRFDIGVRYGDQVEQGMIAVKLTPDVQTVIVGSPDYFKWHTKPTTAQDLLRHNCITLRLTNSDGIYAWELEKDGKPVDLRVHGQAVFTNGYHMANAAVSGCGLAFLTEDLAAPYLADGRLVSVMPDWCPKFSGLHVIIQVEDTLHVRLASSSKPLGTQEFGKSGQSRKHSRLPG